jgi:hypothetical protein
METCKCDHDRLTIQFDPAKARELANAWEHGAPITINLRDSSKDELAHVAAACLTALGEWNNDGQRTHCWRLFHAGLDAAKQLSAILCRAFDRGEAFDEAPREIVGDACRGGWEG